MRVTKRNVEGAASAALRQAIRVGVVPEGTEIVLSAGSSTMGVAWSANRRFEGATYGQFPGLNLSGCYTARAAWDRINAYTNALAVVSTNKQGE